MSHRIGHSLIYGALAGIVIDYIQLIAYYLVFPRIQGGADLLLGFTIISSILIAVAAICVKNKSLVHSLLRWLVIVVSFVVSFVFSGYVGVANFLMALHDVNVGEATQNVIGMLILTTTVVVFGITFIIIFVRAGMQKNGN